MKVILILFLLPFSPFQASALFYPNFQHPFVEVEHNLGRLLTSAVEDVKDAIDCTVSAIENVLSWGGLLNSFISRYKTRCDLGGDANRGTLDHNVAVTLPIEKVSQDIGKRTQNWRDELSHGIKGSISRINESLNEIINRDANRKLQFAQDEMRSETNRLLKVGLLLRKELDKLSEKAHEHINNIDFDPYQASVSDVMDKIKVLHDYEKNEDTFGPREVRNVLDEVLDVIDSKSTHSPNLSSDDKYEKIIKDLEENKFSFIKERKAAPQNYNQNNEKKPTFKDVFNQNSDTSDSERPSVDKSSKVKKEDSKTLDGNELVNLYFGPKDEEEHQKTAEEAQDIFEQSEMSRSFMDDIFSNSEKEAVNVFDNPDLLNIG